VRERFSDGITARDGLSVSYADRRQRGLRTGPRTGNFYTQGPEARGECLFALPPGYRGEHRGDGGVRNREGGPKGGVRSLPVAPLAIRFMTFSARCAW
jgi:hypothetical protein